MYNKGINKYLTTIFGLSMLLIFSCREKNSSERGDTEFSKVWEEATIIHDAGDVAGSLKYIDSMYRWMAPEDKHDQYSYYYFFYNAHRRDYGDNNKALLYSDSMIMVFGADKSKSIAAPLSQAYSSKGDALLSLGKYDEAFNAYYEGRIYAGASENSCALGDHDYRLGMVLYKQERYKKAADYFKSAHKNNENCELNFLRYYRQQELLDNIGLCYLKVGDNDSALFFFDQGLDYISRYSNNFPRTKEIMHAEARAVIYGNMATAYHKKGKHDAAKDLLMQSISINSQPGYDNADAQRSRLKLAGYLLEEKKNSEARQILAEAGRVSDSLYVEDIALQYNKTMSRYHRQENNIQSAYDYLVAYTDLKETIDEKKKKLIETDVNERLAYLQKEQEFKTLSLSNKRKQEYLVLLMIGAFMSLAIGLLIIRNWRRSRQNVLTLSRLNTQAREQKEKLEEAFNALAQSNREKDRILSAVSHDIRNPILAVSSLAELMQIDIDTYSEEQKEYISLIQEACIHALTISNDLIEIASSKHLTELEKEYTDLNALLKSCINLLRFRAAQKNLQLKLEYGATDNIDIFANKEKIMRVITNLITNAIKFTPTGGSITVQTRTEKHETVISIKDEGIGIPAAYHEKIFDMFTEAKRPGTAGEKPFGLGLSIARQIVEAHNGKIWFKSTENKGTTFFISLPV